MILQQRPLNTVPVSVIGLLIASFLSQVFYHQQLPGPRVQVQVLTPPPPLRLLHVLSLGDPVTSAKILMLWLQTFDNQNGLFLSYQELDYSTLRKWLEQILLLDPHSQYPLFAASHVYSTVPNLEKKRKMLAFVYEQFFQSPQQRWPWLAQATILARHQLNDLPLALKYAQAIAKHANSSMPYWAQEMQIFILEDMGELEQARLMIGGLLATGQITDLKEIEFLNEKLHALEEKTTRLNKIR